jgi:hypothetical protein
MRFQSKKFSVKILNKKYIINIKLVNVKKIRKSSENYKNS